MVKEVDSSMRKYKKAFWALKTAWRFCNIYILGNIIIMGFMMVVGLFINVINKNLINELIQNTGVGRLSSIFIGLTVAYILCYFVRYAGGFLSVLGNNLYRLNVDNLFHKIFMYKSYNTRQEKLFEDKFIEKYTFICGNTSKISSWIGNLSNLVIVHIGTVVGSLVLFILYEPWMILFCALNMVIAIPLNKYLIKKEYELNKRQIAEQRFHDYYKDILTGKDYAKELRIYKFKNFIYKKWEHIYNKLRLEKLDLALESAKLGNQHGVVRLFLRMIAIGALLLGVYYERYDVGTFAMLLGLTESAAAQINNLAYVFISGIYGDVQYINDYYDFIMPVTNREIQVLRQSAEENGEAPLGEFSSLEIKNVSYTYPSGHKKAVDNVSLTVRKGEIVSILGYNGSGKTTLSKILSGCLSPGEGIVLFNGIPVCDGNKTEILQYFGIALQEYSRFSLPIKEIVGIGRYEKMNDVEELAKAYEKAGVLPIIQKYAQGDNVHIGKDYDEDGVELSGGEWQKLVIASAYMGEPEVLMLDEPTASVDPLQEMDMIKNFRENLKGKTAILISHRIGFARLADRIIMMQDGKIKEQGTHDELLKQNGYYASIFNEQKSVYEGGVMCL